MRLVSYDGAGSWRSGVIVGGAVHDVERLLGRAAQAPGSPRPVTTSALLAEYAGRLHELAALLEDAVRAGDGARVGDLADVRLGPPVTDPSKVLCVGLNYRDHAAETGRKLPGHPDIFAKFDSTLIGPYEDIGVAGVTANLDFEGELAIVIGKPARNVLESWALDVVAGLLVLNDITARDLQYNGTQWLPGKCVDRSTPCGPWLVTLDEVGDPQDLDLVTRVDGQVVQASNTKHMIFSIEQIIAYVSRFLELRPGDVISTGTPEGIGSRRQPPLWLTPGSHVEVEIDGVGTLSNAIR